MIEPRTYTKIFGESLSSAILTDFLKVVDRFYLKCARIAFAPNLIRRKDNDIIGAVEAMTQLAKVPRFDILSLFFGEAELTRTNCESRQTNFAVVKSIFQTLSQSSHPLAELKQKYNCP